MNRVDVIKVIHKPGVKKKVVGYARVSTSDEHQDSSYRVQLTELEKSIKSNPSYEFIGVFKDRKSGTNTKHRSEFNIMIDLAMAGEIDVIITKSITRFARNILDTISLVRSLKQKNVEIIFQKENISSLDPQMEFILSVLAMHAEEESKNNSENTKWSVKRKIHNGGNLTSHIFGYRIKGESWEVFEPEAKIVRMLFDMYLSKVSYKMMIEKLHQLQIKTFTGKDKWHQGTIEQMLQNEKYAGHMALGKTYIFDGSSLRTKRINQDEHFILNHHTPIISPETFSAAINLRAKRTRNELKNYVPASERVTPFYQFVYSAENQRYLKYVVERPKGKYEIPTLYCYNNDKANRVMITVNNLSILLNDCLLNTKQRAGDITSMINDYISSCIQEIDNELTTSAVNKIESISKRTILVQSKMKLSNYIRSVKSFKKLDSIEDMKKFARLVEINDYNDFSIYLNILNGNDNGYYLFDSELSLKLKYSIQKVKYSVFL